ncbi:hypothetical protein [Streptomyces malaysiensis]|uniref:Uncharacterized protein n=1 Tax=Streptomyces malaysiensis subsp. samsunensis TaxID=459658 RepID=A0A9X2M1T2_STRMQ|nr:hypothetical protein [Streptomyces samsunensis]MCQ8833762.1 hypothetical protein [Streptomyces samsunensis]
MTTNPDGGNGHERAPRWHRLHEALAWMGHRTGQARARLAQLWQYDTVRHMAFSACVTLLGAWLLSQFMPHVPSWAAVVDGMRATIDDPVRGYLATHTQGLPITAATAYSIWKALGFAAFVLGFFHNSSARLAWTVWGAATVIMVWIGTPEPGRQVAAGVALLGWAALSVLALRGLRLRPPAFVHVDVYNEAPPAPQVEVHVEIHLPRTEATHYMPYGLPYLPPSPN